MKGVESRESRVMMRWLCVYPVCVGLLVDVDGDDDTGAGKAGERKEGQSGRAPTRRVGLSISMRWRG